MKPLTNRSILLAEDEPLIALDVSTALSSAGAKLVLALGNVLKAGQAGEISAAILDIELGGHDCSDLCEWLSSRGIPFMFYTGYTSADALRRWPDAPVVAKPASNGQIIEALASLLDGK